MIEKHNHIEMTDQQLLDDALVLSEQTAQTFLTPERRTQIENQLNHYVFEICMRDNKSPADVPRLQKQNAF